MAEAKQRQKGPCLGSQECLKRVVEGVEGFDQVAEEDERCGGVEEGVVPGFFGDEGADLIAEAELVADAAERVVGQIGPCGAREQKGIDPGAEAVTGKGAQEALFGTLAVGNNDRAGEAFFQLGPERKKGGRVGKILGTDAMNLARGPLDRSIGVEVRNKGIAMPGFKRPGHQPDLHRRVSLPRRCARRLEVDGGEAALVKEFQWRFKSQDSRIKKSGGFIRCAELGTECSKDGLGLKVPAT